MAILGSLRGSHSCESTFFTSQIIAILAAILFPVFARAREKARQTSCLSNEKQIMLGVLMYVQDYDDTLPIGTSYVYDDGASRVDPAPWFGLIMPCVNNAQVFRCPSVKGTSPNWSNEWAEWANHPVDYAAIMSYYQYGHNYLPEFQQPAASVWLLESTDWNNYWYPNNSDPVGIDATAAAASLYESDVSSRQMIPLTEWDAYEPANHVAHPSYFHYDCRVTN